MRYLNLLAAGMFLCATCALPAASPLQITEFAAAGHQSLTDEDGDTPDWIEIQNVSGEPASLNGWTLTDDSRRRQEWRFPSTNLPAGGFLVVFASGKDRRLPGNALHTNFKLGADGGSLFLRGPADELSKMERYPKQVAGISFGLAGHDAGGENRRVLIGPNAGLHFSVPLSDRLGTSWTVPGFNDTNWRRGRNGVGFATRQEDGYRELLRTDLSGVMPGRSVGLYVRYPFVVTNQFDNAGLEIQAQYDDGFAAWLNGVPVARRNAPEILNRDSVATVTRRSEGTIPERIRLTDGGARLIQGTNWLAVHVLNVNMESSDHLFRAILDGPVVTPQSKPLIAATNYSYLATPTPGRPNSSAVSSGPRIQSVTHWPWPQQPGPGEPILVMAKVSLLAGAVAQVVLHYSVMFGSESELAMYDDGQHSDGPAGDGIYGASIPARIANPGQLVRYYVLAKDDAGRPSRWPLFSDRRGYSAYQGTVIADSSVKTRLPVIHLFSASDRQPGRGGNVALFYQGEFYDNVALSLHGQISRMFPKNSYNLDFPFDHPFRYQTNRAPVSDLKLLANFADKSKIRNTLAYEMIAASGSIGHFAFPARIQKNGKFFSVAEVVEDGDDRWLERVGRDPGGALYKIYDNLSGAGGAEKKSRKRDDSRDLASFASAVSERHPIAQRVAYAYDNIDLPQCISYCVALALISSGDHGHKNFYVYRDTRSSGEWALLPWDVDLSWGRNWMNQYFNETLFVDNPLNLYRAGHDKARNRLYNLLFDHPEFRQMYLRRLRTVMDELLQPPGTPPQSLIIERRVRELMDLLDPAEFKPSDADLDDAGWPKWGSRASMRSEAQRIIDEYLPGRRNFLFKSSRATLLGDSIPAAQPAVVNLQFLEIDGRSPAAEQFVCITNQNNFAVDITGWRLMDAGIEHRFRPGTVIPAGKAVYAVADAAAFRRRSTGPRGGQSLLVQGRWKGSLKSGPGALKLIDAKDRMVASRPVP
jgi:hypothetical protein